MDMDTPRIEPRPTNIIKIDYKEVLHRATFCDLLSVFWCVCVSVDICSIAVYIYNPSSKLPYIIVVTIFMMQRMQTIKSLPRRCYSSCKGTIIKLKTRKDDKGIDITLLSITCVFAVLILREWSLDPMKSVPIYFCQDHCSVEEVGQ